MNKYNNLKLKSDQNYEVAQIAREKEYYDVAVSRYYYSLFQMIDYILLNKKANFTVPSSGGSHRFTIDEFNRFVYKKLKKNKLEDEDVADLIVLDDLKRWRQQADYKDRIITREEFNNDFIIKFDSCYSVIHTKILGEGIKGRVSRGYKTPTFVIRLRK